MVTTAQEPEGPKGTKEEFAERAAALRDEAARAGRTLLTGDANGRVRRNLLFFATAALIASPFPLAAMLPLLLLALTDTLVVE